MTGNTYHTDGSKPAVGRGAPTGSIGADGCGSSSTTASAPAADLRTEGDKVTDLLDALMSKLVQLRDEMAAKKVKA